MRSAKKTNALRLLLSVALCVTAQATWAFCGFYVSSAPTKLFNHASQVVLAHQGKRTVITMANDFKGDVKDFALVIPVPTRLQREQIHVAERKLIDHLDAYTAPRLVQYFDEDPCGVRMEYDAMKPTAPAMRASSDAVMERRAKSLGVTIEAKYTVGEYDILILSAKQSDGLITWLQNSGYRIPKGAAEVVGSYLKQGMRFFVAKVNLETQSRALSNVGYQQLRPLQIAYEHSRFMLPIRLGTVNANGPQELFVYGLTSTGRLETTNYRTMRLPSDVNVPEFVQPQFAQFYRAMFGRQTQINDGRVVFTEYAWDMNSCDPCAAEPMSNDELRELGVSWLDAPQIRAQPYGARYIAPPPMASGVFVTRLHVRYDGVHFPEDLMFRETGDTQNFQGRYVMQHAYQGLANCPAAEQYFAEVLPQRQAQEVATLAELTGWDETKLLAKLPGRNALRGANAPRNPPTREDKTSNAAWWRQLWK